mgnify:CR=1 FL=1
MKRYGSKNHYPISPIAAAVVTTGLTAVANMAQAESFQIEEVTVTATRRAESTMDVPYNISATTSETLERRGITDFSKLAHSTPGLAYIDSGARDGGINSGLIIRGLNTSASGSSDLVSIASPTVSTYIGETPVFFNLHLKDIERVEILRGPQGTLYGSGSLGGTIRYIHKEPSTEGFELETGTRLSFTDQANGFNSDTHVAINLPINDSLAVRAVAGYVDNQGFIDANRLMALDENQQPVLVDPTDPVNSAAEEYSKAGINGEMIKHGRIAALWDVNESVSVQLAYQYQEDNIDGRQVSNTRGNGGDKYAHTLRSEEPLERDLDLWSLDVEADLGFASITSATSHFESDTRMTSDQSGIWLNSPWWVPYYGGSPRDVFNGNYDFKTSSTAQEFRLVSTTDGDIDWIVGAFYLKQSLDIHMDDVGLGYTQWAEDSGWYPGAVALLDSLGMPQDLLYRQLQATDYEDKAIFGELTYHISDIWQVTFGARFFEQEFENANTMFSPLCGAACSTDGIDPRGVYGGTHSEKISDQIFKLNTSYDLSEEVMVYFTWAEGFRHGGANGIPTEGVWQEPVELVPYTNDVATSWEIGAKGRLWDGRMQFVTTLYLIEWEDVQIDTRSTNDFAIVTNGDTAESQGIEFEATVYLTENLSTTLGYAYTEAELTSNFTVGGIVGEKGDELPGVPNNMATISLDYTQMLDSGTEVIYHLNGSYVDDVATDIDSESDNYMEVDGYTLLDASVSISLDNWNLSLFVDNLSNERAPTGSRGPSFATNDPAGRDLFSYVVRPRTAGIGIKYTY